MTDQSLDTSRPLIMARAMRVNGHELQRGELVSIVDDESDERAQLTADQAQHLVTNGALVHAERAVATPVESPEDYANRVVEVEDLGKGKCLIRAPWMAEGEIVEEDKVGERMQEIIDEGVANHRKLIEKVGAAAAVAVVTGTDGFAVEDKGNGNFEITGPGLDEPLKVRGRQNADEKLTELRTKAAADKATATDATPTVCAGTAEVVQPPPTSVVDPAAPPPAG